MKFSNSSLVSYTKKSPNHSGKRTHKIDRITPHCAVGQCSVESLAQVFILPGAQASCNYGIGTDGRVLLCVDEADRSWCSSSNANDQRAVTIECASDPTAPYAFKDAVYNKLVMLCADICQRNGLTKVIWIDDKDKALKYEPKDNECLLTVHRWFANKSCPGDWLYERMGKLAADINAVLNTEKEEKIVYRTYDDVPAYAKPIIKSLMDKGILKGTGETTGGKPCIDLTEDLIRTLVILERAGVLS